MTPSDLMEKIVAVQAINTGKAYRVEIELNGGERIVIKKRGTRAPSMVQLYDANVNGNAEYGSLAKHFTFARSIDSWNKDRHLKSYPVQVAS